MSNLVIVAIPDENDRVWKVSSEKIPHLTVLFLGDADKIAKADQITQFVEHAANTTLRRFYLPVDRRDELGDDKADVLFFKKGRYDYKAIRDFRMQLLKDNNIRTAYDSAPQFDGPWQPHLTLGYPTSPAKPVDEEHDYPFYDVAFNKIAVWMGDFEGPEFLLKDYFDEYETIGAAPMDVAWSSDMAEAGAAYIVEHHGVKGMRWGVRKAGDAAFRAAPHAPYSSIAVRYLVGGQAKRNTKKELPGIKAQHPEYNKLTDRVKKPLSQEAKAYRSDVKAAYLKNLESVANSLKNPSGTRHFTTTKQFTLKEKGAPNTAKYLWSVKSKNIQHADDEIEFDVRVIFDNDGYIVDFDSDTPTDEVAQASENGAEYLVHSGLMSIEDFLEHYGVKGMHWGQRKTGDAPSGPTPVAPTARSIVPPGDKRKTKIKVEGGQNHDAHPDAIKVAEAKTKLKKSGTAALSNAELREVAQRLQLEGQVKSLVAPAGAKFVKGFLKNQGQQTANQVFQQELKKKIKY